MIAFRSTSDQPFFSVVIPVYNRAHLLRAALDSVLEQTCKDFEIVIVDDGSEDDPQGVVAALNDPRIRLIRQANGGGGKARNTGIDAARGKFVATLDSDDRFLPGHLAAMRRLLDGTTNTVGYARVIVDRGGGRTFLKPPRALRTGEHMATYLLCDRGFVQTSTTVVPTQLARRIRHPEKLRAAEDTDFSIRLFLAGAKFVMAAEPGAVWRDVYDPGRLSHARDSDMPELEEWLEALRPRLPARAYHGGRGWAYAKYVVSRNPLRALGLYVKALREGCYPSRLAIIIALQIFLPRWVYRMVADTAIARLRAGLHLPQRHDSRLPAHFEQA